MTEQSKELNSFTGAYVMILQDRRVIVTGREKYKNFKAVFSINEIENFIASFNHAPLQHPPAPAGCPFWNPETNLYPDEPDNHCEMKMSTIRDQSARTATLAACERLDNFVSSSLAAHENRIVNKMFIRDLREEIESLRTQSTTALTTCTWTEDDDGIWDTGCGHKFELISGGAPIRQGIKFCPYCGKAIRQSTTAGTEQQEDIR
jgi:hypothetical protein